MWGMPELTAAVLTNIESGRRHAGARRRLINIDELVVISQALGVPLALLVSSYPDEAKLELFPGVSTSSPDAFRWIVGGPGMTPEAVFGAEMPDAARVAHLLRLHDAAVVERFDAGRRWHDELHEAMDVAHEAGRRIILRGEDVDIEVLQKVILAKTIHDLDAPIVQCRDEIRDKGWPLPSLPKELDYLRDRSLERHTEIFQFFTRPVAQEIQSYYDYFEMIFRHEFEQEGRE